MRAALALAPRQLALATREPPPGAWAWPAVALLCTRPLLTLALRSSSSSSHLLDRDVAPPLELAVTLGGGLALLRLAIALAAQRRRVGGHGVLATHEVRRTTHVDHGVEGGSLVGVCVTLIFPDRLSAWGVYEFVMGTMKDKIR